MEYTKYEKARLLGSRALQISMGAPFLVKLSDEELENLKYNPIEIAKLELEAGVIPLSIIKKMPQLVVEDEGNKEEEA
tara:strand:- start:409 stop:642 length:234 start_codon:yes stop_codon:yes gene_type:complete